MPIRILSNKPQDVKEPYKNQMWNSIFKNISNESKRNTTIPSIQAFTQRLNLLRRKVEKPDLIELIYTEKDALEREIRKEKKRKEKLKY